MLPPALAARYAALPSEVLAVLSAVDLCSHPNSQSWFITRDAIETSHGGVAWSACEQNVIDEVPEVRAEVTAFWDVHFPLVLTTHSDFDFFALELDGAPAPGSVVHGCAFEVADEPLRVLSPTFFAFLDELGRASELVKVAYPWDLILQAWDS